MEKESRGYVDISLVLLKKIKYWLKDIKTIKLNKSTLSLPLTLSRYSQFLGPTSHFRRSWLLGVSR